MLSTKVLTATAAVIVAIGTMGIGATGASAAMLKPPHQKLLVCKAGSAAELMKVELRGKWRRVWECEHIRHIHQVHHLAPKTKLKTS